MSSDPPELGKGLFGYRKSAVNQIIADRDIMLRQAEGRVRAAESKVAELESELGSMRDRNSRMDEQLERLRQQLDALASRTEAPMVQREQPTQQAQVEVWDQQPPPPAVETPSMSYGEVAQPEAEEHWTGVDQEWPAAEESAPVVEAETGVAEQPAGSVEEDDLPYGAEVRLDRVAPAETSTPAWMQTGRPAEEGDEQDEVAMAAGGYGFDDYDAEEQQEYGEFGSPEEKETESPSPFARFPFTSERFDQGPAEVAPGAEKPSSPEEPSHRQEPSSPQEPSHPEAPTYPEEPRYYEAVAQAAVEPQFHQPEPPPQVQIPEQPAPPPPQPPAVSQETADITNRFLTEELAGILAAAEESAGRIVERARATTQRQIARSNRVWREVQAEVSRFASWREEVEPVIRNVQSKVESVRSEIEEVPERIRQALAPMADTISSIDGDLAELATACNPPLLLTPTGLESEQSDSASWELDPDEEEHSERAFDDPFGRDSEQPFGEGFGDSGGDQGPGHLHAG